MINVQGRLPRELFLACSGGVDSMAAMNFLSNNHNVTPVFINHGTQTSIEAEEFLRRTCGSKLEVRHIETVNVPRRSSQEEHWRHERYKILHGLPGTVVTCHHLDDCVETWIWSSLNGNGKVIPFRNQNVVRPFRCTRKQDFVGWCETRGVSWVEDKSNHDEKYTRNYIRNVMMPNVLKINPGIHKVILKKIKSDLDVLQQHHVDI